MREPEQPAAQTISAVLSDGPLNGRSPDVEPLVGSAPEALGRGCEGVPDVALAYNRVGAG